MESTINLDYSFFLFLLRSNVEILGVDKTKEQLMNIGKNIADDLVRQFSISSLSAKSFKEFKEKPNPLTEFDRTLEINDDMIFILDRCPFEDVIHLYVGIVGEMPPILLELMNRYNEEEADHAVSPYCILHQSIRKEICKNIKIGGKACDILQLGCKGAKGMISFSPENIASAALTIENVESKLKASTCAYVVRRKNR